jgi:sarcosine/dimethylglycine N-methyltransferase
LYESEEESIYLASRRTVERMATQIRISPQTRILDIGSGYGGSARFLAKTFGCQVTALNLSEVENQKNRDMIKAQALDHLIDVVDGSFEDIPFADNSYDIIWSQDAILHSGDRERVIEEVARLLKPGGDFIFTDPMQSDQCPEDVLKPILGRIHLETLGSPKYYRETANRYGMKEIGFDNYTDQLTTHYSRVLRETERRQEELEKVVDKLYIENMKKGLGHWIEGGEKGYLSWGILHFKKRMMS